MKKKLAIVTAVLMLVNTIGSIAVEHGITVPQTVYAETASEVEVTQADALTMEQYEALGFNLKDSNEVLNSDDSYTLEGYQPQILNELYVGDMHVGDDGKYEGRYYVMDNLENADNIEVSATFHLTDYADYYRAGGDDMETQCGNAIGLIPGDLSEEGAEVREQVIIENRLFVDRSTDYSRQRLVVASLDANNNWKTGAGTYITLSTDDWVADITVREQGGFTSMAVGDYDNDDQMEVAVHVPNGNAGDIYFYHVEYQSDNTYDLVYEGSFNCDNFGNRFKWNYGNCRPVVNLETTDMAGHDDLVISVSLPYDTYSSSQDAGVTGVVSYQNGSYASVFYDPMVIGSEEARFKFQSATSADLDGNGQEEIVVIGYRNTGYQNQGNRGSIDGSNMLANVLLYNETTGKYYWAWNDANVKLIRRHPDVHVDDSSGEGESENDPVTITAGRYSMNTTIDTVFCEGVFYHFSPDYTNADGVNADPNQHIIDGEFTSKSSEDLEFANDDESFVGPAVSGAFFSERSAAEQLVVAHGHNGALLSGGDDCFDLSITWCYSANTSTGDDSLDPENATETKIVQQMKYDDYFNNADEDDGGCFLALAAVNMDDDSSYVKYKGKTIGWSYPEIEAVMLSAPYWEELEYDGKAGTTAYQISYDTGTTQQTSGYVGGNLYVTFTGGAEILGNGFGSGIDINAVLAYTGSYQEGRNVGSSLTFTADPGKDYVVLTVAPVAHYIYEAYIAAHSATQADVDAGLAANVGDWVESYTTQMDTAITMEPVTRAVDVDTYNALAEEFNATSASEGRKLITIDAQALYSAGYMSGDPTTYVSEKNGIATLNESYGTDLVGANVSVSCNPGISASTSVTEKESTSRTDGVKFDLSAGWVFDISAGLNLGFAKLGTSGKIVPRITGGVSGTWGSTDTDGATYTGTFYSLPSTADAETGTEDAAEVLSNYAYDVQLVKWEPDGVINDDDAEMRSEDEGDFFHYIPVIGYLTNCYGEPPTLPTNLSVKAAAQHMIALTWTAAQNRVERAEAKSYKVYISTEKDGDYEPVMNNGEELVVSGDTTSCVVTGLEAGKTYYFKLQSFSEENAQGTASVLSAAVQGTTRDGENGPTINASSLKSVYANVGDYPKFNIEATASDDANTLTYQWQYLSAGGDNTAGEWSDIEGATEAELYAVFDDDYHKITEENQELYDGMSYRCIVTEHESDTGAKVSVTSRAVTLYIETSLHEITMKLGVVIDSVDVYSLSEMTVDAGEEIVLVPEIRSAVHGGVLSDVTGALVILNADTREVVSVQNFETNVHGNAEIPVSLEAGTYEAAAFRQSDDVYTSALSDSFTIQVVNSYAINYELNGGTNSTQNPTKCNECSGTITLNDATRTGYTFTGWYTDAACTNKLEGNVLDAAAYSDDITLYAGWQVNQYQVNYHLNGGTNAEGNPDTFTINDSVPLLSPTRTGYNFEGWYTDSAYTTSITNIAAGTTENVDVYAKWSDPIVYYIEYVLDGGTNATGNPASYTVESATITLGTPTKDGYTFLGWYDDAALTNQVTTIPQGSAGNVTLYAQWERSGMFDEDQDGVYEVSTYEDLVTMARLIQSEPDTYASASYIQTNHIDCENQAWDLPIGTESVPFTGSYEGYDYYIVGLRVNGGELGGLFGVIGEGGSVSNLSVADFDFTDSADVAGGIAAINRGTITGCSSGVVITTEAKVIRDGESVEVSSFNSDIMSKAEAGGIAGINEGTIQDSHSGANVSGKTAGGIAGENSGTICNVYNRGSVAGLAVAGGIVGANIGDGEIQYGYNSSTVSGITAAGVAGTSENANIKDIWYTSDMAIACLDYSDSELVVTQISNTEMKTQTLCDSLNTAISGETDLAEWTWNGGKNAGYPDLKNAITVTRTVSNASYGIRVRGAIHPNAQLKVIQKDVQLSEESKEELNIDTDKIDSIWRLALVYADGTYATWNDGLEVIFDEEMISHLSGLQIIHTDSNGVTADLVIKEESGSAVVETTDFGRFILAGDDAGTGDTTDDGDDQKDDNSDDTNTSDDDSSKNDNSKSDSSKSDSKSNQKNSGKKGDSSATTGDTSNVWLWMILLLISGGMIGGVLYKKKHVK